MAVNATAVWRIRPSGNNTNGGGYDPAISGAGTDYTQQNSPQLSVSDAASIAASLVVTSVTGGFTSAMVGNAMYLTGTHFTTGWYFITGFTNGNTVTVDSDPTTGGNGSAGTCHVGGGWANFWTNTQPGPVVAGNIMYVLGSGTPNPAAYTYDYTFNVQAAGGNGGSTSAGYVVLANDPQTPGYKAPPLSGGGMPVIKMTSAALFQWPAYFTLAGLYLVASGNNGNGGFVYSGGHLQLIGCVFDQFAFDNAIVVPGSGSPFLLLGCEIFSSVAPGSPGVQGCTGYASGQGTQTIIGCNIHDGVSQGIDLHIAAATGSCFILNNIIAKCQGNGITATTGNLKIINNTIDGNTGNGIEIATQATLAQTSVINNIISNHTGAGKYGIAVDAGAAGANSMVVELANYNAFYNNTANYNAINAGANDTALSKTPYVAQSTENYTLA